MQELCFDSAFELLSVREIDRSTNTLTASFSPNSSKTGSNSLLNPLEKPDYPVALCGIYKMHFVSRGKFGVENLQEFHLYLAKQGDIVYNMKYSLRDGAPF